MSNNPNQGDLVTWPSVNRIAFEIHKWINKEVMVESGYYIGGSASSSVKEDTLINCNNFYL